MVDGVQGGMRNEELGKTRNNGKSRALAPRDSKGITSTACSIEWVRENEGRKQKKRGRMRRKNQSYPRSIPPSCSDLLLTPVQETSLQAARPRKSIFRPRLGLSNSARGR